MLVREPAVAGRFYPGTSGECRREIDAMRIPDAPADLPERPVGGIVPHAGWFFSGATALRVLDAVRIRRTPATFVLFGATHSPIRRAAIFSNGAWETPLGLATVDERLAAEILALGGGLVRDDPMAHEREHSIEVQVPLIQHLFPGATIVPIACPPSADAPEIGRLVARAIRTTGTEAVCLGSTDLTHYGRMYGFTPKGTDAAAIRWVREENDRRMLDLMIRLDSGAILAEASERLNACGPGAVAAALAAAAALDATEGRVVQYTTSFDVMREKMGRTEADAVVGYVGVVF